MTQADRVLEYIREQGEITSACAFNELGIVQLPRRIHDLRQRGVPITREDVTAKNRYGEYVRHGVYRLGWSA
jgi:hypothetical protein